MVAKPSEGVRARPRREPRRDLVYELPAQRLAPLLEDKEIDILEIAEDSDDDLVEVVVLE